MSRRPAIEWCQRSSVRRATRWLACGVLCLSSGCASLAIRPEDSLGTRIGKLGVRLPLSLLTLSASEYRIQRVESAKDDEAYEVAKRAEIEAARARAAEASSYVEYREWIDYATELESELERRRAQRGGDAAGDAAANATGSDSSEVSSPPPPKCVSRGEGHKVVTECN